MAVRQIGPVRRLLETVIARPLLATLVVGCSILLLQCLIRWLADPWPVIGHLQYLVPFLPPFLITRTAWQINQRRAEHNFIKDAEPILFVTYPQAPSVMALLASRPEILSDSSARHLNCPCELLLQQEVLAEKFLLHAEDRTRMAEALLAGLVRDGRGVLSGFPIALLPRGMAQPVRYTMNSTLTFTNNRLKWQGTLMRYHPWETMEPLPGRPS